MTLKITSPEVGVAENLACGKRLFTGAGLTVIVIVAAALLIPLAFVTISVTLNSIGFTVLFTKVCAGFSSVD